ncbi:single-stranded-DNA-specific exonuclease RecJ, partial [Bacteroides sp. OttesenSCG-928-J23]|nr:single-stranded-DNA-specific exonuclease RecJ [Bacteroides sp. OttesenSCG-928-J23]
MGIRQWEVAGAGPEQVLALRDATGFSPLLCAVLSARGYAEGQDAQEFLADAARLDDPYTLADMDKAVQRIRLALEFGEQICVFGDYDCDGVTSTALLTSYLQSVGARVFYYVPDREKEGYGLNISAVDTLHQMGAQLIITVDNGISAHGEIAHAAALGIDVVVTDHHTPRDTLPQAVAVVNPHRADCPSRCKDLAGVGVAFKLVCALEEAPGEELMEYYGELVSLGTIADVVPLTGENRILARGGLAQMGETHSPGIMALLEVAGLTGKPVTGESVAFGLVPRINACGRMGPVDDAIELLLTDDVVYATELAQNLNALNEQRKKIEEGILAEIAAMLAREPQLLEERLLLLSGRGWHHGVVGIVAAKLMERYGKPCILFSVDGQEARGSGRSLEGFSLIEAISACSADLTRYGGHILAAGLTLPAGKLDKFVRLMQQYAKDSCPRMPVPKILVDCAVNPSELTVEAVESLAALEPFGEGNRPPLFLLAGLVLEGIYPT